MKSAQGLEHQRSLKFLYTKAARRFSGAQKTGVTDRKDKREITKEQS